MKTTPYIVTLLRLLELAKCPIVDVLLDGK